jgi:hypothetical protein
MVVVLLLLAAAVLLLYFWLIGHHWFARVLTFLVLLIPLSFLGAAYGEPFHAGLLGLILGGIAAWFLTGIPIYVRRYRARATPLQDAPFTDARPSLYLRD